MKKAIALSFLVVSMFVGYSQSSTSGNEIVENHIRALGGRDKLSRVKTLKMEMVGEIGGQKITTKTIKMKPDKILVEITGPNHVDKKLLKGKDHLRILNGKRVEFGPFDLEGMIEEAKIFPELTYAQDGYSVIVHGEKPYSPGCIETELVTPGKQRRVYYYNVKTGLLEKILDEAGSVSTYREYKLFGGILFPTEMTLQSGLTVLVFRTTKVQVNPEISESDFDIE